MTSLTTQTEAAEAMVIKGRMVSLTVLELFSTDLGAFDRQLEEKAAQAPMFFRNAPVLLDFEHLDQDVDISWLDSAFKLLAANHFVPVGITGAAEPMEYAARARNIAVWPSGGKSRPEKEAEQPAPEEPKTEPEQPKQEIAQTSITADPAHAETMVVRQPVRSGQKIYARGGDLIVLASVSTGAELLADGHIHIYGTLRGRALAGVQGKEDARIFCHALQADLVSIAGTYVINEDLPADKRNKPVQIFLQRDELLIEAI